ncbi:MAG: hypothetical protein QM669_08615 [Siphonobacter sp.]
MFIHNYLDKNYKHTIAERIIQKRIENIEKIEDEKNVIIEFDREKEKNMILKDFSFERMLWDYVFSIILALLIALFLSALYRIIASNQLL